MSKGDLLVTSNGLDTYTHRWRMQTGQSIWTLGHWYTIEGILQCCTVKMMLVAPHK